MKQRALGLGWKTHGKSTCPYVDTAYTLLMPACIEVLQASRYGLQWLRLCMVLR
jgi:hypothetical protein